MKPTPAPGYETTKPLLSSIALMLGELGQQDAGIQLQELANRHLNESLTKSGKPPGEYLKPLYRLYSIPHGTYELSELNELVAKSYLVLTYSQLERMLRGVIEHYKSSNAATSVWVTKNAKDERYSPLQELHANLPTSEARVLKECPEYALLEYYRVVRVANSHVKGATLSRAEADYKGLTAKQLKHYTTCYSASPNPPNTVSFEDFVLFTRAIKYFARKINEVCA